MDIVILDSAYKHGITEPNISYCLSHFNNDIMLNYPPMKRLFVGFDNVGRVLNKVKLWKSLRLKMTNKIVLWSFTQ